MSIILRTLKGSALTYEEMDRNLSQYFYSSSIHPEQGVVRLHYTGSAFLDTATEDYGPGRFQEIPLSTGGGTSIAGVSRIIPGNNITIQSTLPNGQGDVTITGIGGQGALPAGIPGSIQFKLNDTTFGADQNIFWSNTDKKFSLGTPTPERALHIKGNLQREAFIRLETDGGQTQTTGIDLFNGTQRLGSIGKTRPNTVGTLGRDIYIVADIQTPPGEQKTVLNKIHSQIGEDIIQSVTEFGVGINIANPNKELTIRTKTDGKGIGIGSNASTDQSEIKPITSALNNNLLGGASAPLSTQGLFLHPPRTNANGGNIVVGVLDTQEGLDFETGISRDKLPNRVSIAAFLAGGTFTQNLPIATFLSNRTVGINTNQPHSRVKLDINGQYRGAYKTKNNYTDLDFNNYSVIKVSSNSTAKETVTLNSVPIAGVEGVLILTPTNTHSMSFPSNQFRTAGDLQLEQGKYHTIKFVSDGTRFVEISRTGALS